VSRLPPRRLAQGFARSACAGANAVLAPDVVPLETDAGDLRPVPHPYKACTMSWRQRELGRAAVACFACSHISVACRHCERRLSDCAQQLDAIIRRWCSHVLQHERRGAIEDDRIPNVRRKCRRSRRHGRPRPRHVQRRAAAALRVERRNNRQSRQCGRLGLLGQRRWRKECRANRCGTQRPQGRVRHGGGTSARYYR
jgi:hypothetical protein